MYEIHAVGGMPFMAPLTLILLINLGVIASAVWSIIQKKNANTKTLEMIKQLGGLALAWGVFGNVVGLYFAFGSLEELKGTVPFEVIMGGLKVGLITIIYGLLIFIFSLFASIILRLISKQSAT